MSVRGRLAGVGGEGLGWAFVWFMVPQLQAVCKQLHGDIRIRIVILKPHS